MIRIDLNHWFVNDNSITISLMRYCVKICIDYNDINIYYRLTVYDSDMNELVFNFYSLEDAVWFTESVINKCNSYHEIIEQYEKNFNDKKFKLLEKRKLNNNEKF